MCTNVAHIEDMEASGETPDAMLYRLRFAPPEKLDTLYNGTLHILRLSGKAARVYAIHPEDSAAAMEWIYAGRGQAFTKRREDIRKMSAADAKDMFANCKHIVRTSAR